MKPTRIIEICANSAQSCVEAEAGGAKRVELCAGIPEEAVKVQLQNMIREKLNDL